MRHVNENQSESASALEIAALQAAAGQWAAHDPDPATAAQLLELIAAAPADPTELADSFAGNLAFGTAGLRAAMGPGPNRMNKVVVRRAAAGVAAHLLALAKEAVEPEDAQPEGQRTLSTPDPPPPLPCGTSPGRLWDLTPATIQRPLLKRQRPFSPRLVLKRS
ncbi:hypothetical protein NHF46_04175 [Arthrobacter alpinus]|nr:hypothetical protein [Arthrobacter alpinus]